MFKKHSGNSVKDWNKLLNRVSALEEKIYKMPKRIRGTEAQRFLVCYHLGLISKIKELQFSQNQQDLLVSVMIDIDLDNAKKFLSESSKQQKQLLETISNYTFLSEFFSKKGFEQISIKVEEIFTKIRSNKDLTK